MHDKVAWLTMTDFQKTLLPAPPSALMSAMFPPETIAKMSETLTAVFSDSETGYTPKARLLGRKKEDVLAEMISATINTAVLKAIAGKTVEVDADADADANSDSYLAKDSSTPAVEPKEIKNLPSRARPPNVTVTDKAASATVQTASGGPSSRHTDPPTPASPIDPWKLNIVDIIPSYVMTLSPDKDDKTDDAHYKVDAAIFRADADLIPDRPNWVHQRMFIEFKRGGSQNDPFDDTPSKETESWAIKRSEVRGQVISYAANVFKYQHRSAVFSLFVIGPEFRVMWWDRSGMFVSEKVNYVESPRTLVEILVGYLMLDDKSQGIDTTATLLDESSKGYTILEGLADRKRTKSKFGKLSVLPFQPNLVLPAHIPTKIIPIVPIVPDNPLAPTTNAASADAETSLEVPLAPPVSGSATSSGTVTADVDSFIFEYAREYFQDSLVKDWPRFRLSIDDQTFLVGKPVYETPGLVGRGTRGYVAYHEQGETLVFLKDTWRPFYEGVRSEGEILHDLRAQGVKNIPTLLCHGAVDNQMTRMSYHWLEEDQRTNEVRKAEVREAKVTASTTKGVKRSQKTRDETDVEATAQKPNVRHYAHHRIALKEVCLPLTQFTSSKQLISIVGDCIEAHASAVEKCRIIHRDISSGNLLILPTFVPSTSDPLGPLIIHWRGILADWELSKVIPDEGAEHKARQPERTGTWRYMSVASLFDPLHIAMVADEIESFFNVVLYNAVRFVPSTLDTTAVRDFIKDYFTKFSQRNGMRVCGEIKAGIIKNGVLNYSEIDILFGTANSSNDPLNELLRYMLKLFKARYALRTYESKRASMASAASSAERPSARRRVDGDRPASGGRLKRNQVSTPALVPPSHQDHEHAALLDNHTDVIEVFKAAVTEYPWPEDETLIDSLIESPSESQPLLPPMLGMVCTTGTGDNDAKVGRSAPIIPAPSRKPIRPQRAKTMSVSGNP